MAGGATEVEAAGIHMYIQRPVWLHQRTVQVTMFYAVTAAAIKVAAATGLATGLTYILRHPRQINLFYRTVVFNLELAIDPHIRISRMAGARLGFQIGTGRVMASQAVHIVLGGKIKVLVFPAVADMAGGTARVVGLQAATKHIGLMFFAQHLPSCRMIELPLPVGGLLQLSGRLGMASQTGAGNLRATGKVFLQLGKLAVIGGRTLFQRNFCCSSLRQSRR